MPALFDTFKTRAEAVSAEVHRFATRMEAIGFILTVVNGEHPLGAVWAIGSLFDGLDPRKLTDQIPGISFDVTRESAESARIGISQLEWAVSDTGTLVTDAAPVERRLVSSLPAIHIAIVATDAILPDMAAVFGRIHPDRCGYISMITGPSRTADIERVLTIGVHGPSRLVIVFVDELGVN